MIGIRNAPVEKSVNLNERLAEPVADLLGPALIAQLRSKKEDLAWLPNKQRPRKSNVPYQRCVNFDRLIGSRVASTGLPLSEWYKITKDPWILSIIRNGYKLEFKNGFMPTLSSNQLSARYRTTESDLLLKEETLSLILKKAVVKLPSTAPAWRSHMFVIAKKGGGKRPIIDLSPLNRFLKSVHFKMEGIHMVPELVEKGDWFVKIDLKDAYFSIPIAQSDQAFLAFDWEDSTYAFQVLPFGLCSAPRVFTKMMRPVVEFLRSHGVRLIVYLDDMLIMSSSEKGAFTHGSLACDTLGRLGFRVNFEKSILVPSQRLEFLGFDVDSISCELKVPTQKRDLIVKQAKELFAKESVKARVFASFIGTAIAVAPACKRVLIHARYLQRNLNAIIRGSRNFDLVGLISAESRSHLQWFAREFPTLTGESFVRRTPSATLTTDASNEGWGAVFEGSRTGGRWSHEERELHINVKELKAILFGLLSFKNQIRVLEAIRVETDNSTSLSYVARKGGVRSHELLSLAHKIWDLAYEWKIDLQPVHITGLMNVVADEESRVFREEDEWSLDPDVCEAMFKELGLPEVDLFASRLNFKLNSYISWFPDPHSMSTNAFASNWEGLNAYAFPPFSLALRVAKKAIQDRISSIIIVAPLWEAQAHVQVLNEVASSRLLLMPGAAPILTNGRGSPHPSIARGSCKLAAWKILREDVQRWESQRLVLISF